MAATVTTAPTPRRLVKLRMNSSLCYFFTELARTVFPILDPYRCLRRCAPSPALRGGGLGWGKAASAVARGSSEQVGSPRVAPPPHPPPRRAGEGVRGQRPWPELISFMESLIECPRLAFKTTRRSV